MTFKDHVEEVLQAEIDKTIKKQGYILETKLYTMICEKYGFSSYTVRGTLRRIYPKMSLMKRRMSDELKRFYGLTIKGCPIVYMPDSNCNGNN